MKENLDKWIAFLKPETLKDNLTYTSLYIAIYESFRDYIVTEIKSFYCTGFSDGELIHSKDYEKKVLKLHKNNLVASLLWLKQQDAIDDNDLKKFENIRSDRNKLAHELLNILFEGIPTTLAQNLSDLIDLRIKIEKWWVLNIEIPTNSDFDAALEVKDEDIHTSSQLLYKIIFDMLLGDEKSSNFYYEEFLKFKNTAP